MRQTAARSPELSGALTGLARRSREFHYGWVEHAFGVWRIREPPRERPALRAALIAICDVQAWWILSHDLGLPRTDVRATLILAIQRLIGEQP